MAARRPSSETEIPASAQQVKTWKREAREAQVLREVATALGAALDIDELLELVLTRLRELLEVEGSILFLLDARRKELFSRAACPKEMQARFPVREGLLSHVLNTGRSFRFEPGKKTPYPWEWEELERTGTQTALLTPLKNNLGRTMGVLLSWGKQGGERFSAEEEELQSLLAKQAAIAVDNYELFRELIRKNQQLVQAQEQLTRRVHDLELLFELERSTAYAPSLEELARAVLARLARACDAEGALLVLSEEGTEATFEYTWSRKMKRPGVWDAESEQLEVLVPAPSDGLLSQVLVSHSSIQLDSLPAEWSAPGVNVLRSFIGEPLAGDTGPIGAMGLLNKKGGPFTAEDLGLLRLVSANVSTAVRLFHTNQARMREERLSSIGRLLSQVVHDLKSPLTVISGYVQLMEESSERQLRQNYAQEILKQFETLGAMQREILEFARGETKIFARKVILDRFFEELIQKLEQELADFPVQLSLQAERKQIAYFDSEKITRALQNLIRNAAEALGAEGGEIRIEARTEGEDLSLRVSDEGPGVPPEVEARLFQSFVTVGKKEGTGLGLAIVKRIVQEHGGSVSLVPQERGACFELLLPRALRSPRSGKRASSVAPKKRAQKK